MINKPIISTWTHWQNSLEAEELILEISSNGTSLKWSQRPPRSAPEWSWAMGWKGPSHYEFGQKVKGNWENHMIRIFQWMESYTVKQMLVLTVRVTARVPNGKVNHLSKVIWDKKIISEFTRFTCSTRKG